MLGAAINLGGTGDYIHWGVVQISWANAIVIILMVVVFVAALLLPRHNARRGRTATPGPLPGTGPATLPEDAGAWSAKVREQAVRALPPDKLLPDRQPAYVASWAYTFGVLTLAALALVVLSGACLAIEGPTWWHHSSTGLFFNSLHLWSTEAFMFFMVVHLWCKFFMAAWRGRRRMTWITGGVAFVASVGTAFTGYLSQQNFDAEWISTQAKDGINATGAGAVMNVLNVGQMLMWHIVLLPAVLAVLVVWHVLLVRRRGVVPPFERAGATAAGPAADGGDAGGAAGDDDTPSEQSEQSDLVTGGAR